jgi:hypothetical protein
MFKPRDVVAYRLSVRARRRMLEDERWPRAAARWLGRFLVESPAITISEALVAKNS